ncbi:MAG: 1-deoxy-D-xylulose-5-phosphate synthase [Porticoccaceae bacterium]
MPKKFTEIPLTRPVTPLLDRVESPAELRQLGEDQLSELADELRAFLLYAAGCSGGHFGAGLGVVELTIALHFIFNTPTDRLVWDVGHQTYPHKILTGRRDALLSIRTEGGISGFPKRSESKYDTFGVGHSSTSISAALGMALAARLDSLHRRVVAIIGDGAMTAGMAFEALNHAAHTDANMLVILNDNNMSISRNVGGLATYFSKIWASRFYNNIREGGKKALKAMPSAANFVRKTEEHLKAMVAPGIVFEELGFNYIGPIDGHDLPLLIQTLNNLKDLPGPILLHVITRKGQGYLPAEEDPIGYHAFTKIEPKTEPKTINSPTSLFTDRPIKPKFQQVFGDWLSDMAARDDRLIGITPAMCEGSGMQSFARDYSDRFYDVAIAEQHAVTLAAGLACEGKKPVVAIYSTFLQRAYDQLIHDVALQKLDVLFAIDRAGLVGEDGATHAGSFDISYLRCIPNMVLMTPSDENETRQMLYTGYIHQGPAAVRYPRGTGVGAVIHEEMTPLPLGRGVIRRQSASASPKVAILNFGTLLPRALESGEILDATVADMRFVKPLDQDMVAQLAESHELLVTLEENAIMGGAGSAVCEYLNENSFGVPVMQLGLPDYFVDHAGHGAQLAQVGLNTETIVARIRQRLLLARRQYGSADWLRTTD